MALLLPDTCVKPVVFMIRSTSTAVLNPHLDCHDSVVTTVLRLKAHVINYSIPCVFWAFVSSSKRRRDSGVGCDRHEAELHL